MHSGPIKDMFAKAVMLFIDTKASKWWDIDGNYSFYRFEDLSLLQRILSKYALEKPECRNNFQNLLSEISSNSLFSSKISISSVDPKINFEKSSYAAVLNGLLSIAEVERTIIGHQSCSLLRKEAKKVIDSLVSLPPAQMEEAALIEILNLLRHFDLMTDVQKYSKRLTVKNDSIITQEFLTLTSANKKWAKSQFSINTIKNITQGSKNLTIIGVSVWGVEFINFFCDFYLPSILQNIEKRNIEQTYILSIVTDSTSRLFIENQKIFENLKKNIIIRFTETKISMSISGVMPFYKYLGLLDHQHIYLARELKANLILIPPDCVFGESSFKEIHKLLKDFECVTASCLEASKNQIIESLKCYINNSKLKISASELLNLAAKYKSKYFQSLIFNSKNLANLYPREFFWRVDGGYYCHAFFMHPIAISYRVLTSPLFHPNHQNVDWALISRIVAANGNIYTIDNANNISIVHCTTTNERYNQIDVIPNEISNNFLEKFRIATQYTYPIHRELFTRRQFFDVLDDELISINYLKEIDTLIHQLIPELVK